VPVTMMAEPVSSPAVVAALGSAGFGAMLASAVCAAKASVVAASDVNGRATLCLAVINASVRPKLGEKSAEMTDVEPIIIYYDRIS
jgi:hypothetical protein